jgi:hypothetical protein
VRRKTESLATQNLVPMSVDETSFFRMERQMLKLNRTHRWTVLVGMPVVALLAAACASQGEAPNSGQGGGTAQGTGGSTGTFGGTASTNGGSTTTNGGSTTTNGGTASSTGGVTGTTGGIAGTTGGVTGTTGGVTGTTGGATGTTGGAATTGGSGGAAAAVKLCATKKAITVPLLTNFDTYDGKVEATAWVFPFNGMPGDATTMYGGLYTYSDMTGTPVFGMVGGANASTFAASVSNVMATGWGGAIGVWMGCVDATAFKGISFQARGTIPTGNINVGLVMESTSAPDSKDPAGGGTCTGGTMCKNPGVDVPVTADWALKQIPWSMFTAGVGSAGAAVTPNGDGVAGFTFQVGLVYMPSAADPMTYVAVPGPYQLDIDDIGFY